MPSAAVARGGDTMVALLGLEHFRDGAVAHVVVLTETPGVIDWAVEGGLSVRDDCGTTYVPSVLAKTQGLGQVATTIWLSPPIPADATRLDLDVSELFRVSAPRGDVPPLKRPLSDGPWPLTVDLRPARTVADPPAPPERRQRIPDPGSVPARTIATFHSIIPIGQARMAEEAAICVIAAERYTDRWVVTLSALGRPNQDVGAPAIGRARVSAWDDRGNRYRATPIQGTAREDWSEVWIEMVPPLDPMADVIAIKVEGIPRGNDIGPLPIAGPLVFGVRVPHDG